MSELNHHDYAVDYSNANGSSVEVDCFKYAQWQQHEDCHSTVVKSYNKQAGISGLNTLFVPGQFKRQFNELKLKIHRNLFDQELYRMFFLSVNVIFVFCP